MFTFLKYPKPSIPTPHTGYSQTFIMQTASITSLIPAGGLLIDLITEMSNCFRLSKALIESVYPLPLPYSQTFIMHTASITSLIPAGGLLIDLITEMSDCFRVSKALMAAFRAGIATAKFSSHSDCNQKR